MSYDPAIKIYDSAGAGTPDDITESILGTLEFQLAAMGGCLGASFRLAAVRPVFDPAANAVLLVQALQPVGYPV